MQRVLVFNFFAGVMDRGIPLYAEDVVTCMKRLGVEVIELRCPKVLQRAPRPLHNAMFVVFEQLVAPIMRIVRRCSLTVYPYNSAGVIDAAMGRSVLVVHDLIPNHRRNLRLAAKYIRTTQAVHRMLARPMCAASPHTLAQLRRLPTFRRCPLQLWSNPFYAFEAVLRREAHKEGHHAAVRVLLCSGMGPNKDYAGALKLFRRCRSLAHAELHVLGFGDDAALARRRVLRMPEALRSRIRILPRLSLADVVREYRSADLVWVHSRKEGFGRCVIEGRLSGRPVVASNIGAFRKLPAAGVYLYRKGGFEASVHRALARGAGAAISFERYHEPLETSVRDVLADYA